jgi:hypothetical protein
MPGQVLLPQLLFHTRQITATTTEKFTPLLPQGSQALRDIAAGDELVCDYSVFACPEWYQALCKEYNVLTTADVVSRFG